VVKKLSPGTLPDRVVLQMKLVPMGADVLQDLVASGDLDAGLLAQMPTFNVGAALEWKADAGVPAGDDTGLTTCVSKTGLTLAVTTVDAPVRTRCSP
jgi:hypothetical protein